MVDKDILQVNYVSFKYNEESNDVLKDVSFSVRNGEWLAIVGHNGSGKSTLAKILTGILFPSKGKVSFREFDLNEDTIWDIRKKVGMVFQNPDNQFVGSTVNDDIAFGLENNGIHRDEMLKRIEFAVKQVKMEDYLESEPHQLSGGQKQRVAIAGVIALHPQLIILDEATSMLDPKGREEVIETIWKLKKDLNLTVLSITHDLEEAARADRMIVMKEGVIFAEGTPREIFKLDEELVSIGLDIPFPVKLSKELAKKGISLSKNHVTEEELIEELWTLGLKN
ncbi:energy-coupling factor ABC transporter ATP-binding protein [Litchfieldia salsa]|uniref:Energy-coupling factor transport system ATP-binding protein n=1 Tax=Litchfieldia salsa TaxID=930152 RepID=A0A1H0WUY3_9BACI|nr:energy-coupling factor ABC transporter ATP-binding protein [Litchfieldia salsa]SDP94265.1 energy-coupling factor transport system ATP-binding protein [Litchfieldia salsa]